MVITQTRSKRTQTGGQYKDYRKLKQYEIGSLPTHTKIGKAHVKHEIVTGGNRKSKVFTCEFANLLDPKSKKFIKAKIETVVENPANRHFVRRNILTQGTIIKTDKGNAKVTSRPGQDGTVNAVLVH